MKLLSLFLLTFWSQAPQAQCLVQTSSGRPAPGFADLISQAIRSSETCPQSVSELRKLFQDSQHQSLPSMVANRGRNNPALGSFSFFERVLGPHSKEGEVFFGHFTQAEKGQLTLDQHNAPGKLLIEAIAWDSQKGYYNFYELIGSAQGPEWFYRGDTADILADNRMVHLQRGQFGNRLRCSGCHSTGGPIMKELDFPHNDWWAKLRTLPFGPHRPNAEVTEQIQKLREAAEFAKAVKTGITKLEASPSYQRLKNSRSLAEQLRPLFCENEINLKSDLGTMNAIQIPFEFLVHPALTGGSLPQPSLISRGAYQNLLARSGSRFPETFLPDADHAWLTPVRSFADDLALQSLLRQGIISEKFMLDVLSVDSGRPLFSTERCELLKLLPGGPANGNWKTGFLKNLSVANFPSAKFLLAQMSDASLTPAVHREKARKNFLEKTRSLGTPQGAEAAYRLLLWNRQRLATSDLSQNPRGQILEPGFRVIFPQTGK